MNIRRVEEFLLHEAHLLDDRQFEAWMALFTDDGFYWAPASLDQADPLNAVSLIYDDRAAMRTRILRLRHPRIHAQTPPSRTVRLVANAFIEDQADDGSACTVRAKFIMYEYRPSIPDALERVFAGTYRHRLMADGDGFKIASKTALLANCDARLGAFAIYF